MDLAAAAAEFFDASARIALGASLLVSTAAFVVMYLYMRTVFQESRRLASAVSAGHRCGRGQARTAPANDPSVPDRHREA